MERDSTGILIFNRDSNGLITFCRSESYTLPTTADKFASGCILTIPSGKTYTNDGDSGTPSFQDVNSIATSEIADNAVTDVKFATDNVGYVVRTATATADGLTTGTLTAGTQYVTVTSASADNIIVLPAPVVGTQVTLNVGANGFELRSSSPTTVAINGGTGADVESAIAANSTVIAICISATAWKAIFLDADSDVAKVEVAA